ncbi:MAG: hypothetical protein MUC49_12490 [Raineya sp.]|jgi:hypothetical protein|nr:hypothetical protein [Raineya sp.]
MDNVGQTMQVLEKVLLEKYQVTEFINKSSNWCTFSTNFLNTFQAGIKSNNCLEIYLELGLISSNTDYSELNLSIDNINNSKLRSYGSKVIVVDDYLKLFIFLPLSNISEDGIWILMEELLELSNNQEVISIFNKFKKSTY